ncbi:hypothetical protein PC121_g8347 [Phytophthora cactorum]|nr:hypothetical protein PC120_g20063 [Phytophthora cactorum]KAG3074420.1 hypothetical protein PC121_g8347 [Phytophthora cactorum]KAG4043955.1 hypothetical protein PC123_g20588 [Phytophthora cactorum]
MREYKKALKVLQDIAALFKHGEYSAITRFTGRLTETTEADDFKDMETVDLVTGEAESDELSTADRSDESASASVQTTQLGMSSEQVETNIDQLGTDEVQVGTDEAQVGTLAQKEVIAESNEGRTRSVNLDDEEDMFELRSPPKASGRPKQKPKAAKAKRNLTITWSKKMSRCTKTNSIS